MKQSRLADRPNQESSIAVYPPKPMRISELSRRFPAVNVARWGGGVIQSYGGDASRVELDFDTQREGFIWIKFAGKRALVHKDELTYFARFAKGHAGV